MSAEYRFAESGTREIRVKSVDPSHPPFKKEDASQAAVNEIVPQSGLHTSIVHIPALRSQRERSLKIVFDKTTPFYRPRLVDFRK